MTLCEKCVVFTVRATPREAFAPYFLYMRWGRVREK
jgi:hypothetical protein